MKGKEASLLAYCRSYYWLLVAVWTGCIAGSLIWNLRQREQHGFEMARSVAQVTFDNDILCRRWCARQGGVYVHISENTPSNPYLNVPERDVITTSGLSLTLVNPAYMARQINEMMGATAGSRGHITSLKPTRPENAPDVWEAAALRSFEQGLTEVISLERTGDGEYVRLMRPFVVETGCLACHAAQGYREGDIRGGISVSVPMAPLRAIERPMTADLTLAHLGLWGVGLAGIGMARRSLGREILAREQAEEDLRRVNAELEFRVAARTTELQHRARQLQKLTLELSQAEERERRRVAVLLHEDLQQQIAGAKFHLSLVRSRAEDDRQRTCVDKVDGILTETIEKSRSLSHDLSPAVVHLNDLAEVLQWLVNRVRVLHGLTVHVDLSGDMTLHSEALAMFLFRAAQEMLFNVVKHAHVREAALRVRGIGRHVCLSVSDRGRGFDPQELRETSGFGLFSIRERVELLGGRLKVKSAKGQGSTFRIVVPAGPIPKDRRKTAEDISPVSAAVFPPSSGRALRVLLVDDHEIVRQGLASLLRETPEIVVVGAAANGREAIDLTNSLHPDVVIMDVSMPLMSGDEATRQIKTYLPGTRVIALSRYDEADQRERMYQAGAEGYVLKTASSEVLLAAIRGRESGL